MPVLLRGATIPYGNGESEHTFNDGAIELKKNFLTHPELFELP
jgi:hypothetical protein